MGDTEENNVEKVKSIYRFQPYQLKTVEYQLKNKKWPVARSGHRVICSESNMYCLGGFNPHVGIVRAGRRSQRETPLFNELWSYNFATRKWNLCLNCKDKDMPEELASNAITANNDVLITYGGTGYPFGAACSNQCYVFSTKAPSVTRLRVEGDLPTPQYGHAILLHNNYLYTIGGTTGFEYSCDVHRLDLLTKQWETIYLCRPERNDPSGRYRHEIVYTGKVVYILGGGTAQVAFDLVNLPVFDLELNRWLYVKTQPDTSSGRELYPEARRCHSCVQYETDSGIEAIITGGFGENDDIFDDIWKINLNNFCWTRIPGVKLPRPIYFHSAATPGNGCMYIFGGIEIHSGLVRTNQLYKMWTTIPKLSEICWDAICFYNKNLDKYSKIELAYMGIPRKFLDRIANVPNSKQ